jgi:MoaA/NifB/PqqE/SkfB family radical SAM enzyme
MTVEITDTSLMMILLLEECNFACPHCIRDEEPMAPGYRLTFEQLKACLRDCRRLPSVSWVHFSGGEPTLWEEEGRDLVDLLLAISTAGLVPGFTSNGSAFLEYDECERFLRRYLDASIAPLRLYLSIDSFHGNFDGDTGRARSLDHVLECRRRLPEDRAERLETRVLTAVSKDPGSLLPDEMVAHYESLGVEFIFVPLRSMGRARALADICPVLESDDPEDLGAYAPFHRERADRPDRDLEGDRALSIILIGGEYHLFLEGESALGHRWRGIGHLGALPDSIVGQYSETGTA